MSNDKFPRNHPYSITKFFCPCCNSLSDQYKSVEKFQRLLMFISHHSKYYYTITSAFRCLTQNKKINGAEKSDHLSMLAIDVAIDSTIHRYQFLKYLLMRDNVIRYRYIRIYKNHIHISLESPVAKAFDNQEPELAVNF